MTYVSCNASRKLQGRVPRVVDHHNEFGMVCHQVPKASARRDGVEPPKYQPVPHSLSVFDVCSSRMRTCHVVVTCDILTSLKATEVWQYFVLSFEMQRNLLLVSM